jgi:DNA processing protein
MPSSWDEVIAGAPLTTTERTRLKKQRTDGFADREAASAHALGYTLVHAMDGAYPALLRKIPDPPAVLYVQGDPAWLSRPCIALVGSRNATAYGRTVAERLASQLASHGITVASGFARGIDRSAHEGALRAGGGTVAGLGCSLDIDYPSGHGDIRKAIAGHGCLVSEFPIGTSPAEYTFPRRNRIISGISLGVVVVEALEKSGALITARHAMEQDREVFAVPGPVFAPTSKGPHALLRDGAKLVESVEDIIDELKPYFSPELFPAKPVRLPDGGTREFRVLDAITSEPVHVDELGRLLEMPMASLMPALSILELGGCIRQHSGKMFSRI